MVGEAGAVGAAVPAATAATRVATTTRKRFLKGSPNLLADRGQNLARKRPWLNGPRGLFVMRRVLGGPLGLIKSRDVPILLAGAGVSRATFLPCECTARMGAAAERAGPGSLCSGRGGHGRGGRRLRA